MTRKQLPFFIGFFVLMFGAMACACLGSGIGVGGIQATANAAFTQAASSAATAAAGGNLVIATPTKVAAGQPTSEATTAGNGTTASGGPSDIPVISGQINVLIATGQLVTYQTKKDIAAVVSFYKDAMPKNGWTQDTTTSVETPTATVLQYKKDTRTASVTIGKDPSSGGTLVAIAVQ